MTEGKPFLESGLGKKMISHAQSLGFIRAGVVQDAIYMMKGNGDDADTLWLSSEGARFFYGGDAKNRKRIEITHTKFLSMGKGRTNEISQATHRN